MQTRYQSRLGSDMFNQVAFGPGVKYIALRPLAQRDPDRAVGKIGREDGSVAGTGEDASGHVDGAMLIGSPAGKRSVR